MSDVAKVSNKVESHPKRKAALKLIARMAVKEGVYQGKIVAAVMKQLSISYPLAYYYVTKVYAIRADAVKFPSRAPKVEKKAKPVAKKAKKVAKTANTSVTVVATPEADTTVTEVMDTPVISSTVNIDTLADVPFSETVAA